VREALALHRKFDLHAMIDVSDGLALDLGHLCEESGAGAILRDDLLPISEAAERVSRRDRKSPLDHALEDGEDYELLFAVPPHQATPVERTGLARVIGEVTSVDGLYLWVKGGRMREIKPRGWQHAFGKSKIPKPN
jgi:thiamine-monophosphate kinase